MTRIMTVTTHNCAASCSAHSNEVDPMLRTTGAGFLSGAAAVPFFTLFLFAAVGAVGCGQRAALSKLLASEKRHIHSLFAERAGDTVRQTAIGARFSSA